MVRPILSLLLVLFVQVQVHAAQSLSSSTCTLNCPIDAPCVLGANQALVSHPIQQWEEETHIDHMHCACPTGWTGVKCDHIFEACDGQAHQCYHGGECIPGLQDTFGNTQLFCDCSDALANDGTRYVGKYCETPSVEYCGDEEESSFCVNGGDCNPNYPVQGPPCHCPDGYEGLHCEFQSGTVPECILECEHGGHCVIGIQTPQEAAASSSNIGDLWWTLDEVNRHMWCECPEEYDGPSCQVPKEKCDDSRIVCFHGGTCVSTMENDQREYHCDCTTASTEATDLLAGRYCQYEASSVCDQDDGNLFCVNNGRCKADPVKGCECLPGYTGFKCEFRIENPDDLTQEDDNSNIYYQQENQVQDCGEDLVCFHGGKCAVLSELDDITGKITTIYKCDCDPAVAGGNRYDGPRCQYQSTDFCDDPYLVGLLNVPFCVNHGVCSETDMDTCECPNGWTGPRCEIHQPKDQAGTLCGNNLHCLNGGGCVQTQVLDSDGNSSVQSHCDCSSASNDKFIYAGTSCQHQSTSLCTRPMNGQSSLQGVLFCTNHGTCATNSNLKNGLQAGCDCVGAFTGFSCEFEADVDEYYQDAQEEQDLEQCGAYVCHNGGTCVTTIVSLTTTPGGGGGDDSSSSRETKYCDCNTAVTETTSFAGDSCQHPSTTFCTTQPDGSLEGTIFCTNGGSCGDNVQQGCNCPAGWSGFRCEYRIEEFEQVNDKENDFADEGEACGDGSLYCFNGGYCDAMEVNGETEYRCECSSAFDDESLYAGTSCQFKSTEICDDPEAGQDLEGFSFCTNHGTCPEDAELEQCYCPKGWLGFHCEFFAPEANDDGAQECGDTICQNGGTCITTLVVNQEDGQTEDKFHCECATAYTDTESYAGESCEHKSTSFCTEPAGGDDLKGIIFCTNHGTCRENVHRGCECPSGFTGFRCEYEVDFQDALDEDNNFDVVECAGGHCLNGGTCISFLVETPGGETQEEQQCDCSTAFTGTQAWAGEQCEHEATSFCTEPEGGDLGGVLFCVNEGSCRDNVQRGCDCSTAWEGFKCEFAVSPEDVIDSEDYIDVVNEFDTCGDTHCFHGGMCTTFTEYGVEQYRCDCSTAFTDTDLYAGPQCQYKSTTFCSQPDPNAETLEGVYFCVNGGRCLSNPSEGCSCPSGYGGFLCELPAFEGQDSEDKIVPNDGKNDEDSSSAFVDDPEYFECHLDCQNDGICAKGAKDLGILENVAEHVDHLNDTHDESYFEHCVCRDGWTGLECAQKVKICGEGEHICLHGSTCVSDDGKHACDCSDADQGQALFAGDSCQHAATDVCTLGEPSPGRPFYFCVNEGICKDKVTADQPHPGCDCPDGWMGNHCELREGSSAQAIAPRSGQPSNIAFLYIIGACAIVASFLVAVKILIRTSPDDKDPSKTCMPFRRRRGAHYEDNQVNIAPRRNSRMVQDPPGPLSSNNTDPMTMGLTLEPDDEPEPYHDEPAHQIYIGPPRDEDGNELHNVDII